MRVGISSDKTSAPDQSRWDLSNSARYALYQSVQLSEENERIARVSGEVLEAQGDSLAASAEEARFVQEQGELARARIRAAELQVLQKKTLLWGVILALFVLNLLVLWRLLDNHGRLL